MAFILWWYGAGWRQQVRRTQHQLLRVVDTFSIDLLLKTLFLPFRQISADRVDGSIEVKMRAMLDKLISRVIGAVVRSLTILAGTLVLAAFLVVGFGSIVIWPFLPLAPIVGAVLAIVGWVPWSL